MNTIVLFGNHCLTNNRFTVNNETGRSASSSDVQRFALARQNGSVIVQNRINEKTIGLTGQIKKISNLTDDINKFYNTVKKEEGYLRTIYDYLYFDNVSSSTGWTASGDISTLTISNTEFQKEGASIKFTINQNTLTGSLTSSALGLDLTNYQTGAIGLWVYIEDAMNVTSINYFFGTDSSNYLYSAIGDIHNGWNFITTKYSNLTTVGTPTISNIAISGITITLTNLGTDTTANNYYGGMFWINTDKQRTYNAIPVGEVEVSGEYINKDFANYAVEFLVASGYSENWIDTTTSTTLTNASSYSFTIDYNGSIDSGLLCANRLSSATSVGGAILKNETTNETIAISQNMTGVDGFSIDCENKQVTYNSAFKDFTGVFPRIINGKNNFKLTLTGQSPVAIDYQTGTSLASFTPFIVGPLTYYYRYGQSFVATATGVVGGVKLSFDCSTSNTTAILSLYSDSAGSPNTLISYATATIPVGTAQVVTFGNIGNVTNGSTYHLVISLYPQPSWQPDYSASVRYGSSYASGSIKRSIDNSTWGAFSSNDLNMYFLQTPVPVATWKLTNTYKEKYG